MSSQSDDTTGSPVHICQKWLLLPPNSGNVRCIKPVSTALAKSNIQYQCGQCGGISKKWAGQCPDCGEWNTMVESRPVTGSARSTRFAGYAGERATVQSLGEIMTEDAPRSVTGISELDRVLGGGLVAGSVILVGGDPGIGKSTLLLQVLASLCAQHTCLYVTGEESLQQVALRARRLRLDVTSLRSLSETSVEQLLAAAAAERPAVMVVDSIQTMYTEALQSAPGAVAQVRESAAALVRYAKSNGITVFLVGHVTKDGGIAGPRVLEHMVDAVLYFEGDSGSRYRVIRALKNRFGAVNELGVFAMTDTGLKPVSNPSALFLSGQDRDAPGSAVMVTREGTRPLLVEIQALVSQSHLANPRRLSVGMDPNRLAMLLAVLQRQGGMVLHDHDVFINAVGGIRIAETAADLPVLMALLSSFRDRPLPSNQVIFGEVGLAGEVRPVYNGEERLREACKHGFDRAIVPRGNAPKKAGDLKLQVVPVDRVADVLDLQ